MTTKLKLQGVRLPSPDGKDLDFCVRCAIRHANDNPKLRSIKEQLNALLKDEKIGVALKDDGLPSSDS